MILIKTKIKDGPKLLKSNVYNDSRGFLRETFDQKILKKKFPFDIMSYSKKNVVRGLHIQLKNPQAKLITVTYGKIFDVAVDLRQKSKTFGKYVSKIIVSTDSQLYLDIARKFGINTPFLRPKSISGSTIVTSGPVHCAVKRAKIPVGGPCATRHGKFNE
mgnify:CR=1 FL=1